MTILKKRSRVTVLGAVLVCGALFILSQNPTTYLPIASLLGDRKLQLLFIIVLAGIAVALTVQPTSDQSTHELTNLGGVLIVGCALLIALWVTMATWSLHDLMSLS